MLDASILGAKGHRYRAMFTVVDKTGTQRFSSENTAKRRGALDIVIRHVKRLPTFSKVSVKVVDLTAHKSQPQTYSIGR